MHTYKDPKLKQTNKQKIVTGITYTMHVLGPKLVSLTGKIQWQAERGRRLCYATLLGYLSNCLFVLFRFLLPQEIVKIYL